MHFPVAVFPLIFPVTYYFTLVQPRYRHPIDPVLMILASYLVWAEPTAAQDCRCRKRIPSYDLWDRGTYS
jgi:hypothetical protein